MGAGQSTQDTSVFTMEKQPTIIETISAHIFRSPKPFRFARFPPELRNIVYEHILTAPDGLHLRESKTGKSGLYLSDDAPEEFNQLKYVCRQMYMETAGLELKFNKIILPQKHDPEHKDGYRDELSAFLNFHRSISPKWLSCIRVVEFPIPGGKTIHRMNRLELNGWCNPKAYTAMTDFCATHPQTTVRLTIAGWSLLDQGSHYVVLGCLLQEFTREPSSSGVFYGPHWEHDVRESRRLCGSDKLFPSNFRFVPTGSFDESRLRKELRKEPPIYPMLRMPGSNDEYALIVAAARNWFENGV